MAWKTDKHTESFSNVWKAIAWAKQHLQIAHAGSFHPALKQPRSKPELVNHVNSDHIVIGSVSFSHETYGEVSVDLIVDDTDYTWCFGVFCARKFGTKTVFNTNVRKMMGGRAFFNYAGRSYRIDTYEDHAEYLHTFGSQNLLSEPLAQTSVLPYPSGYDVAPSVLDGLELENEYFCYTGRRTLNEFARLLDKLYSPQRIDSISHPSHGIDDVTTAYLFLCLGLPVVVDDTRSFKTFGDLRIRPADAEGVMLSTLLFINNVMRDLLFAQHPDRIAQMMKRYVSNESTFVPIVDHLGREEITKAMYFIMVNEIPWTMHKHDVFNAEGRYSIGVEESAATLFKVIS